MIAAFEGHIDALRLLQTHISTQASALTAAAASLHINTQDAAGNTALHHCCFGGNLACAQYLVEECDADYLLKNKEGMLPVQFAVAGNHTALVSYLHKLPPPTSSTPTADNDDASESGINSLHRAAMHGSLETLKMLIDEKIIEGNSPMPNLNTALHLSSQRGMNHIVDYLISHSSIDVDINAQNEFGLSPLHFACIGGYSAVVASLLKAGAIPSLCTASRATPLHLAAGSGSHEICEMLVESKEQIDLWAEDGDGECSSRFDVVDCDELSHHSFIRVCHYLTHCTSPYFLLLYRNDGNRWESLQAEAEYDETVLPFRLSCVDVLFNSLLLLKTQIWPSAVVTRS